MATSPLLTGTEPVLIAQVPRAGGRWEQVHFNMDVGRRFFRMNEGEQKTVSIERVDAVGAVIKRYNRKLVLGPNRNYRIEFDFAPITEYPSDGRPVLVIIELGLRQFRYITVMPGNLGHAETIVATEQMEAVGKGLPRVITTLDEVELRWDRCPLRGELDS